MSPIFTSKMLGQKTTHKKTPNKREEPSPQVKSADRTPETEPKAPKVPVSELDPKFQPERGPEFNNRQTALNRILTIASAMQSQNLFDLFHKDCLRECPRVWIVGGGPSAKGFDFSLLEGEVVIACNRCFEIPEATAVLFMDKPFVRWVLDKQLPGNAELLFQRWKNFGGPKIAVAPPGAAVCQPDDDPYYVVDSKTREKDLSTPQPWFGLNRCNNSGLSALKLAWGLGAKEIHLIGIDMNSKPMTNQEWHHGGYNAIKSTDQYPPMVERFEEIEPYLLKDGVQVINHSHGSAVRVYPKRDLPTAPVGHKLPLVVGFYTINTPYEEEIKGMQQSFRFFGFDVHIVGIPSRSSWSKNCYYKPTFIKQMMEAHPGRQIIWADADSRLRRYPTELIEFLKSGKDFSIATAFMDWEKINPRMAAHRATGLEEISSAFIVINNTIESYDIITRWEKSCAATMAKADAGKLKKIPVDDRLLEEVYYKSKRARKNWVKLPTAYAQIFDLAKNAGVPVVEQMQASRRNKNFIDNHMNHDDVVNSPEEFLAAKTGEEFRVLWKTGAILESVGSQFLRSKFHHFIGDKERVLDVGCGSGHFVLALRNNGQFVRGIDLTLEAVVKYNPDVIENTQVGASWLTQFPDGHFDHLVSCDTLQCIPGEMVEASIMEMFRLTKYRMTHIVDTREKTVNGVCLHKTVNSVQWWYDMFKSLEPRGREYEIRILDINELG